MEATWELPGSGQPISLTLFWGMGSEALTRKKPTGLWLQ